MANTVLKTRTTINFPVEDRLGKMITGDIALELVKVASDAMRDYICKECDNSFATAYRHYDELRSSTSETLFENDLELKPKYKIDFP